MAVPACQATATKSQTKERSAAAKVLAWILNTDVRHRRGPSMGGRTAGGRQTFDTSLPARSVDA
jgi:hypothetical protein